MVMQPSGFVEIQPVRQASSVLVSVRIDNESYDDLVDLAKKLDQKVITTLREVIDIGLRQLV